MNSTPGRFQRAIANRHAAARSIRKLLRKGRCLAAIADHLGGSRKVVQEGIVL
jgi:hypothetical protein